MLSISTIKRSQDWHNQVVEQDNTSIRMAHPAYRTRQTETLNCQPTNCLSRNSLLPLVGCDRTLWRKSKARPLHHFVNSPQRVKRLASKLHVHSVNFAAKFVHTRRALSSTIINSHQEPVSGQACNPHWFFLSFFFTVLGTKVTSFP